jgi:hypothetical protein
MGLFQKLKDWWTLATLTKEFHKEVDQNVNMWSNRDSITEVQEDQAIQQKYYNGVTLMKRRIKERIGTLSPHEYLSKNSVDLLTLAKDEDANRKALREVKESVYVYSGADVKTDMDKSKMIDKRISHYGELQKDKIARNTIKAAKKAWSEGNVELHKQLLKEWETLKK